MQKSNSIKKHYTHFDRYFSMKRSEPDDGSSILFGVDIDDYLETMVMKNITFILIPESHDINQVYLTEQLVKKLEKYSGYQFYWRGAYHYNTSHPHTHLLVNGIDKQGKEIYFPKDIVKTFIRETARELCTSLVLKQI